MSLPWVAKANNMHAPQTNGRTGNPSVGKKTIVFYAYLWENNDRKLIASIHFRLFATEMTTYQFSKKNKPNKTNHWSDMYGISISSSSAARYALSPYLATIYQHHQSRTFSKPSNSYWTYSFRSVPTMIVKNHSKKKIHLNSINQTESIELRLGWLSCIGMLAYCFAEIVIKYEIPSSDITNTAPPPLPSTTKHPGLDWVYLPLFFF